ncbi:unnamed protein product [Schistosoma curassoni]|uniref:Uncharacterized protein n=1 Tax=Schistosoma curassoni TaxID=6186 RepID=A0A183KGF3_9TREM|nr:unnamed protein product [Schistosoma curassoni]
MEHRKEMQCHGSRIRKPCAPLLWNWGFPTPLGGLSMSTNPVKAPDIRFSSSRLRKKHP